MLPLASIQQISEIAVIKGAFLIEHVFICGRPVVVRRREFHEGEGVIYLRPGSFIPTDLAPFLTKPDRIPKTYKGIRGEWLWVAHFRGQPSEGLVLPLSRVAWWPGPPELGTDVTDLLGIRKWEPHVQIKKRKVESSKRRETTSQLEDIPTHPWLARVKLSTLWSVLMGLAQSEGQARLKLLKDPDNADLRAAFERARAEHEAYREVCLRADRVLL